MKSALFLSMYQPFLDFFAGLIIIFEPKLNANVWFLSSFSSQFLCLSYWKVFPVLKTFGKKAILWRKNYKIFNDILFSPMTGMMLTLVQRRRMNSRSSAFKTFSTRKKKKVNIIAKAFYILLFSLREDGWRAK